MDRIFHFFLSLRNCTVRRITVESADCTVERIRVESGDCAVGRVRVESGIAS